MSLFEGYFDKDENQITNDYVDKEVYDGNGNRIGYYSNGVIRGNNGNLLGCRDENTELTPNEPEDFIKYFNLFKADNFR